MKKEKNNKIWLDGLQGFLNFLFWMLVFGFLVRIFEFALLTHYHQEPMKQFTDCLLGFGYDLVFFSKFALVLYPLYVLIYRTSPKAALWTFRIMGTVMLLISNAMIMYYIPAYIPLDKVFFDYSVKELVYISHSSGAFVWWGYTGLLLIPALFLVVSGKTVIRKMGWCVLWLALAVVGLCFWKMPSNTVCNKQEFFWRSLFEDGDRFDRFRQKDLEAQRDRILSFQSKFPEDEFVDYRYPFAHIDKSPDVLTPFFDLNPERRPDLVFIISEGLSREFSGYNSQYPSATPFLDSLADQGLCWLNCMSSSQRTIGVLPTMFGSLPFGKRGFMQSTSCPRFYSLPALLKENGYNTSFLYGAWLCFDNMCSFLKDMDITEYLPDYSTYPDEYKNSWGLLDEHLFSESLKWVKARNDVPSLDIYMTLTTHDPFDYPDKERYTQIYVDKLKQSGQLDEIHPSQYGMYASYLYYDDCLRDFFTHYKEMPQYNNTIFVITGDHCFNAQSPELNKYHVPFVIWSPMLKEPKRFPAMIAHRDVTPSFLAMMKNNYGIKAPEVVSWINTGLDVSPTFRANTFTPQLKNSRMMDNMVYKDWFYDAGNVYQFGYENERLTITPTDAKAMTDFMVEYKALDDYVMNNDALVKTVEGNQRLIFLVDSVKSVNYVLSHSSASLVDTLERNEVFMLSDNYPFEVLKMPLSKRQQSIIAYCDFDINIPYIGDFGDKIALRFELMHSDGQREMIKELVINYDWYESYGKWRPFSMTQTFNKTQLQFSNGDQLLCFFLNGGSRSFFISDFRLKIVGIDE